MTMQQYTLPAVLDMGNGSIRVIIADALADGSLVVLGVGEEASAGMDEGRIIDLGKAATALQRAVRTAEIASGRKIEKVLAAVSGECIKSEACEGKTVVGGHDSGGGEDLFQVSGGVVGERDIFKIRQMGVATCASSDVEVLDIINKTYHLDKQNNIRNPLGMAGKLLTGNMHLIVVERPSLENLEKCIHQAGMSLAGQAVFSGLAAAHSVLNEEEKRLGVCLLDIGAHTSEMMLFFNGGVYETDVYLEAANLIHMDISTVHHTTLASAEKCKKQVGVTVPQNGDESLSLVSTSGESISVGHSLVLRTATSRVEELISCVERVLRQFESKEGRKLTAGIVLTGGGAQLPGLTMMMHHRLHIPVRIGVPAYSGEMHERVKSPQCAVAMGLLMMANEQQRAAMKQPLAARLKNFFFPVTHSSSNKEKHHEH